MLASTVAVPSLSEGRIVRITRTVHAEAQIFTVSQMLSEEEAAELRQAVAQADADGREVRLQVGQSDASDSPAGGGGQSKGFDINIQTLERGE
jgi:hypothetical protein